MNMEGKFNKISGNNSEQEEFLVEIAGLSDKEFANRYPEDGFGWAGDKERDSVIRERINKLNVSKIALRGSYMSIEKPTIETKSEFSTFEKEPMLVEYFPTTVEQARDGVRNFLEAQEKGSVFWKATAEDTD